VTPVTVSTLSQTLPLFSDAKSALSPQVEKGTLVQSAVTDPVKEAAPVPADTVSISSQSRLALPDVKKKEMLLEATKREKAKKEEASAINNGGKADRVTSKVQFVYDLKGELSVRYMDTSDRLIYQVPSQLMLHLKEAASKSDSSVNTKA
jgi:hypothetical protein